MKGLNRSLFIFIGLLAVLFSGCIHEYPHPVKGPSSEIGEKPGTINALVEVYFDITWEGLLHNIDFSTKARDDRSHRFILEVIKDGIPVCHDITYLSPDEFTLGKLNHKLSASLEAAYYQIAVWYDTQDEEGNNPFKADALRDVRPINLTTENAEIFQCAYASDVLDLREYKDLKKEVNINKELNLSHAGARFEIVTTDIQRFISTYKESLNQGDSFTVFLTFPGSTPCSFDLPSDRLTASGEGFEMSGHMRLPFAEYDELKIAEGFIFCEEEDEITMKLGVKNSALLPVCQTEYFTFPVKRGYITTITGNFLSSPVDGIFSVNTLWEGEIIIEI